MARRLVALLGILAFLWLIPACASDADRICERIYDECKGSLVDDTGASVSREGCVQQLDERADTEASAIAKMASCVEAAECDSLPDCLNQ